MNCIFFSNTFLLIICIHSLVVNSAFVDLTYPLNENVTVVLTRYRNIKRLIDSEKNYPAPQSYINGYWLAEYSMRISEHTGTHMDSPYFSYENGTKLLQIPIENLVEVPAVVVDISEKVNWEKNSANYAIKKMDLIQWEKRNMEIPQRSVALIRTGWGDRFLDESYIGKDTGGIHHYPGLDISAAKFLSMERNVIGVGIATLTIDPGYMKRIPAKSNLAFHDVYILENVANLHLIANRTIKLWVMPMKLDGAAAAPIRLIADTMTK